MVEDLGIFLRLVLLVNRLWEGDLATGCWLRSAFRINTFREMEAAGLVRGRYWAVLHTQERPPQIPWAGLWLNGVSELSCLALRACIYLLTSPGFGLPQGKRCDLGLTALFLSIIPREELAESSQQSISRGCGQHTTASTTASSPHLSRT